MQEIFARASHRSFADRPVEREKIEQLLRAAMAAPTAVNQRPWEFYVVENKEILEKMAEASQYAWPAGKASVAIVVCYRTEGNHAPEMLEVDCALATENIWLELTHLGLGGVMLGIAPLEERMKVVAEALALPDNLRPFTVIPFGYPKKEKERPDRYEPDRVHWLS